MTSMRRDLPTGTVTFLFTDVEGSTRLLVDLGAEAYAAALAEQRRIVREAFLAQGGVEVDAQGDAFFVAFPTAAAALLAAASLLAGLAAGPIRVRMGIHTGTPRVIENGYVGIDVHRAARIAACGHGGQVLVSAATAVLLGGDGLRDLGVHRLKDLSAPERIYQLGDVAFPPLRSLHQTNLPLPATPFLGRRKELTEVLRLLSQEGIRMVTLTGPGGIGKTRLALQAAAQLGVRFPNGVWWVPLASVRDPRLVLPATGQALGIGGNDLAAHIADRSMLILFDNFEQVIDAAAEVADLLTSCPNLHLLVTSREPLHLGAEQAFAVPPLVHHDGVQLFLARARAIKPDFRTDDAVADICRRLDELPLALELAAARVTALSPAQILERLEQRLPLLTGGTRDMPERQQTLRAAIAWSYELLEPEEQRLLARLAIFRSGCTLEAAERVADADVDTLQALVDQSLLRHDEDRFSMLETIRDYAAERLEASGEAVVLRGRHAEYFLGLAEDLEPKGPASGQTGEWLDRLEREHDNLRAALDWLEGAGESERALRLAGAVSWSWARLGTVAGLCRIAAALSLDGDPGTAVQLVSAAEVVRDEMGYEGSWLTAMNEETLATVRSRLDEAAFAEAWSQGQALTVDEALRLAFDTAAAG
jgi:predicted ATPase/class 3 adenylate cyclase